MMMSVTRKTGYGRKSVLIVSLSLLVALLLSLPLSTQADAASNYKVKAWTMGMQCYTVYEGTLPQMYEPTFYTESIDTYRNLYTGKDITITFYYPYNSPNREQAEALSKYLLSQSRAKYCWADWYSTSIEWYSGYWHTSYFVYKIEGWDSTRHIDDLINANAYYNSDGESLSLMFVGHGDQIEDSSDYIHNILNCCNAVYLPVSWPRDGATVGFQFRDSDNKVIEKYIEG